MTLVLFMVLPVLTNINNQADFMVRSIDTLTTLDPPEPPPEEKIEEEPPPEEEDPPELDESPEPLDLSQLELALNPGISGDGWMQGDFGVDLNTMTTRATQDIDELFNLSDLDQKPRPIYQTSPLMSKKMHKATPVTVYILFVVGKDGRVENPKIQKSTNPIFEKPALDAIKKWKFEPGKVKGEPVSFRMRVPITFQKQ